ncbi:MAG: hypothetical protein HY918_05270 [Candidatus Doudnabacteria bacterium]|nr:hypothetical protein [Candidatus Doudnabacteria bacterium]
MKKQKYIKIISGLFLVVFPFLAIAQSPDPNFNPSKLIEDKTFSDTKTFGGADGIQKFLVAKNSVLANTSPDFLAKLKEPQSVMLKEGLGDPQPNLGRLRTAAELIWDASIQSGLNPQVILVTLNKEQGLITSANDYDAARLQKALDHAMGFDCPDSSGCGNLFPGFYFQIFGNYDSENNRYLGAAKSLMKSFTTVGGRGPVVEGAAAKVGQAITLDNTMGGYENIMPQQTFIISNNATAALYRYTPHVFNGNYNFWKFFQGWFKYPNGTLLKLAGGADLYIIENGVKQLVPQFVAQARALDVNSTITVSPTEYDSYTTDKPLGPVDNTVVQDASGTKYVFISNVRHQASDLVIKQRGLDPAKTLSITPTEAAIFDAGSVLPPKDGTVIRGVADQSVYLVANGQIKMFSAYTFAQNKIKAKDIYTVPDAEIATYSKNGFVAPLDGSLVKTASNGTVYLVENSLKRPILADIFKIRGFSFKNVSAISEDEMSSLPIGAYATPKDRTFFAVDSKTGPLYMFKEGTKHSISSFVAKQRGITPDYVFSNSVAIEWYDGIPVPPANNTIIKGDSDQTVFLVVNGQLRPLTYQAFKNRKITAKKIVTLPQIEVDAYAKGDTLTK